MRTTQITLPNDPPLAEEVLLNFSEEAVKTCLYLIDQVGFLFYLIDNMTYTILELIMHILKYAFA